MTSLYVKFIYRTRAIITRGLYIFYPISKDHFFVFKESFSENSVLIYGLYSREPSNQEQLMMARVRYFLKVKKKIFLNNTTIFLWLRRFSNVEELHKGLLLQDWIFRLGCAPNPAQGKKTLNCLSTTSCPIR